MGTGEIKNFNEPPPPDKSVEIKTARPQNNVFTRLSSVADEGVGVEVYEHEVVITEDDRLRVLARKPGDPEIRVRDGDPKTWEDVKRDDDR